MMSAIRDYERVCEEAVRAGGATVLDWVGRFETREKGPADLVTEADLASQQVIRRMVLGAFPEHDLLGEEEDEPDRSTQPGAEDADRAEYRWIVDPLDGTTNYVHRVPHFSISLALECRGELLTGAVYDPSLDECFTATAGKGAFLNGRPIRTSDVATLPQALAVVGFPPNVQPDAPDLRVFLEAVVQCQAIRRTGSAALNLCYLAAGRFDVYWSFSTKPWDVAAGALILREAGGKITSTEGGRFNVDEGRFLAAANEPLHDRLHEMVRRVLQ